MANKSRKGRYKAYADILFHEPHHELDPEHGGRSVFKTPTELIKLLGNFEGPELANRDVRDPVFTMSRGETLPTTGLQTGIDWAVRKSLEPDHRGLADALIRRMSEVARELRNSTRNADMQSMAKEVLGEFGLPVDEAHRLAELRLGDVAAEYLMAKVELEKRGINVAKLDKLAEERNQNAVRLALRTLDS